MATITANISASDTTIPVSAELDNGFYTLDSENIYVHGSSRGAQGRAFDRLFLSVDRGIGGSTAATHTSGATLTRYYPDAASSGAVIEVLTASVTLTDAQVKALPTTPIEIVPAPGVGSAILYVSGMILIDTVAGEYTNIDAGAFIRCAIENQSASVLLNGNPLQLLLDDDDAHFAFIPAADGVDAVSADVGIVAGDAYGYTENIDNVPLRLLAGNGAAGDWTGGNVANWMRVTVVYTIVDVTAPA